MKDRVKLLIEVLLDKTAREDERSDAAMDLGKYKDSRAVEALAKTASDPNEDDTIIDDCAVSMAEISIALNEFYENLFKKMVPFAQRIVSGIIMARNPEIIKQAFRNVLVNEFNLKSDT